MHIFHSCENIKTYIFTAVKIQDLTFSRIFFQYGLREATLYGISVSFLWETTIVVPINKKSESLRSLKLHTL